jgi:DeoR/GlpR family transcriptional regulator of sugar metabolism
MFDSEIRLLVAKHRANTQRQRLVTTPADERRNAILDLLGRQPMLRVADLSERFGVSEVSIRRDLQRLEESGLLRRVHGGVVANPMLTLAPRVTPFLTERMQRRREVKERIGIAAAQLVAPGDHIMFDAGTTTFQVARAIPGDLLNHGNLTVITCSLLVAMELGVYRGVNVILLGGLYQPDFYMNVTGPKTIEALNGLHADKLFLGADGISITHGVTIAHNLVEAETDKVMIASASQVIVVADSSKIGQIGLTSILPLSGIHTLVTDADAPADFVAHLRGQGAQVVLV